VIVPADMLTLPPVPVVPDPTDIVILPEPDSPAPVDSVREPDDPEVDTPENIEMPPLIPDVPAFDVEMLTPPLDVPVDAPLVKDIAPPVFVEEAPAAMSTFAPFTVAEPLDPGAIFTFPAWPEVASPDDRVTPPVVPVEDE